MKIFDIYTINLFSIEYEIAATGDCFLCKALGNTAADVIEDLTATVGKINVISLYRLCEVNRITNLIKYNIIELSSIAETKRPPGRPKKYNIMRG